ncbi:hypothetical protein [Polaribacter sp.]
MTDLEKKQYKKIKELEYKEAKNDQFMNGCLPLIILFTFILYALIFG